MRTIIAIASAALLAATASAAISRRQNAREIDRPDDFDFRFNLLLEEDRPADVNPNHECRHDFGNTRMVCCEPSGGLAETFGFLSDFNTCTEHPPAPPKAPLQAGETRDIGRPAVFNQCNICFRPDNSFVLQDNERPAAAGDDDVCVRSTPDDNTPLPGLDVDIVCCTADGFDVEENCVAFGPSPSLGAAGAASPP